MVETMECMQEFRIRRLWMSALHRLRHLRHLYVVVGRQEDW